VEGTECGWWGQAFEKKNRKTEERVWEASREKLRGWLQHGVVKPEVAYFSESTRFLFFFAFARYLLFFFV
jgi:hypothetical protein